MSVQRPQSDRAPTCAVCGGAMVRGRICDGCLSETHEEPPRTGGGQR